MFNRLSRVCGSKWWWYAFIDKRVASGEVRTESPPAKALPYNEALKLQQNLDHTQQKLQQNFNAWTSKKMVQWSKITPEYYYYAQEKLQQNVNDWIFDRMVYNDRTPEWHKRDICVAMKSKCLWTVERRQVGNESTNLFKLLKSRNLVADVELELVLEDGIWEPDLEDDDKNSSAFFQPAVRGSTCQQRISAVSACILSATWSVNKFLRRSLNQCRWKDWAGEGKS